MNNIPPCYFCKQTLVHKSWAPDTFVCPTCSDAIFRDFGNTTRAFAVYIPLHLHDPHDPTYYYHIRLNDFIMYKGSQLVIRNSGPQIKVIASVPINWEPLDLSPNQLENKLKLYTTFS